jgi:hypothetical protein
MWPAKFRADAGADVAAEVDVERLGPVGVRDFFALFELHPQTTRRAAMMSAPATRLRRRSNPLRRPVLRDEYMQVSVRVANREIQDASTTDRARLSHTSKRLEASSFQTRT